MLKSVRTVTKNSKNVTTKNAKTVLNSAKKYQKGRISKYWYYYPHTTRELVSPKCGIFKSSCGLLKYYVIILDKGGGFIPKY